MARQITVLPRHKRQQQPQKKKDKARQHKRRPKTRQAQGKTRQTEQNKTRQNKKETLPKLIFGGPDASLGPPKVFLGLHYCFVHHCCSSILGLHYCQNPGGSQLGPSRTKAFILMQGLSRFAQVRLQSFHAFEIHSKCYPKSLWGTQVRSKQRCLKIPFQNSPLGVPSWSQVFPRSTIDSKWCIFRCDGKQHTSKRVQKNVHDPRNEILEPVHQFCYMTFVKTNFKGDATWRNPKAK